MKVFYFDKYFDKTLPIAVYLQENDYKIENVYNAEETRINWRNLPQKTLVSGYERSCSGIKVSKVHITALICTKY